MNWFNLVSIGLGVLGIVIGVLVARHYYNKQKKAETIMGTFIESQANQAQSIANGLKAITNQQDKSIDWMKGKIEGIFDNMAALNGTLNKFYNDYYGKSKKI